ncbi:MAG: methyltransferase [Epsilonproteobacteria bacterium]|nr:methyltransferase [Campylobacterota bacterium]
MKSLIEKISSAKLNQEFKRLYHGRGEEEFRFLTIDSIDKILFVQFYEDSPYEKEILEKLKEFTLHSGHENIIVKRRFTKETFAIKGEIPKKAFAIENRMKFKLNFYNQNIGYFGDMREGRKYVERISENKNILNLFAYTCGFSLFAKRGGAKEIANVDMNKSALATGMANHQINDLSQKGISFWPYNILKAFPKLKKKAPYDIIIIDPPTFQKGSFEAAKDYQKLIKNLSSVSHEKTTLIACVNSPFFEKERLIEIVERNSRFKFKERIENPSEYTNSSLKNLVFI